MAFIPVPNVVMVEVRARFDGQKIENRFMIDALTFVSDTVLADITNLVSVWAQATYFDWVPVGVTLTEVVGTDLSIENGSQHTIVPEGTVSGGRGGDPMPNETTIAVSLRSGARGRSARGRAYVLGLARTDVVGNNVTATYAAAIVPAFQTLIDDIAAARHAFVIVSYRNNKAPRPGGPVKFLVTTASLTDVTVDSQRRRKPGNGT